MMTALPRDLLNILLLLLLHSLLPVKPISSFQLGKPVSSRIQPNTSKNRHVVLHESNGDSAGSMSDVDEYRNGITQFLSNFMQNNPSGDEAQSDPLADIDFNAPKARKMSLDTLAAMLDKELYEKEWFVTGRVNPVYFDDRFQFQDPDVKLTGVEEYARGVLKLFDQSTSRAQIISTVVNTTVPNTITVTWRLSGRVNIGPNGLPIKPYICYTDFTIDEDSGLVVFQEDRFDIPGWDILLSALFPFLIGKVTKEPAPEVEPRVFDNPKMNQVKIGGLFSSFLEQLGR
eukprot:CCRYP_012951-RA/>CCRYP_012951-RA protein AED:0.04 eAED:0.04 QI:220/1/1/1/0.16/0.14/7/2067/286